jgi:L-lysine 2,3-aminomutase
MIKGLRGITASGYCVPQFIVDSPGGKIPISPNNIIKNESGYLLENYKGETFQYAI